MFKRIQKNWSEIDIMNVSNGMQDSHCKTLLEDKRKEIAEFLQSQLEEDCQMRGDYRELLELSAIFLGSAFAKKFSIRPTGAVHHARWMSPANYCLKIFLLQSQFALSVKEKQSLRDVCTFIVQFYVKAWFRCPLPQECPNQDLNFIINLKKYESVDADISKAAINKFCNHLWYLSEENVGLAFFDTTIPDEIKSKMVESLNNEGEINPPKRLNLKVKNIDDHFSGMLLQICFSFYVKLFR